MTEAKEILDEIRQIVSNYNQLKDKLDFNATQTIINLMKDLSSNLFYLEDYLDTERRVFYKTYINYLESYSSTESEKRAKHKHFNKRKLERIITAGYKVLDTMKSHQSLLKSEKNG